MANILIVDDDIYVGNMMEEVLRREGYDVIRAYSGTEAILVLDGWKVGAGCNAADGKAGAGSKADDGMAGAGCRPDLVLLDLMLPGLNGEDVLPRIKGIPVIVVSAKADIDNKVDLLLGGAADYITKPFEVKELLARVAVQLRGREREKERERDKTESAGDVENLSHIIKFKDITLNDLAHEVDVAGEAVRLTRTEYAILKLLMQNPKQVITKSVMLDRISVDTPDCTESSLKIHVSNLRRKLREASKQAKLRDASRNASVEKAGRAEKSEDAGCAEKAEKAGRTEKAEKAGRTEKNDSDYIEAVWGIGFKMQG